MIWRLVKEESNMADQEYVDIIMQGAQAWNKWQEEHDFQFMWKDPPGMLERHGHKLERIDFKDVDFSGKNLEGFNLSNADLSRANLSRANLRRVNLYGADLNDTNLEAANLEGARLDNTNFIGANLCRANLSSTTIETYVNFSGANLSHADFHSSYIGGYEVSFRGADLHEAILRETDLSEIDFSGMNLSGVDLRYVMLSIMTDFSGANLSRAIFKDVVSNSQKNLPGRKLIDYSETDLLQPKLQGANLSEVDLSGLNLTGKNLNGATLSQTNLAGAALRAINLSDADLSQANLRGANLEKADLTRADLSGADLSRANLNSAILVETNFTGANLTECSIYGISAWNVHLEGANQKSLIITPTAEPTITVDNLKVAQFIYLLLYNKEIREVINTITSKVVLILGRFTNERKVVLDALRDELRKQNYSPVIFDFDKPSSRDYTETVRTLAHMSRFIIADLTAPRSIPQELQAIVPHLAVPVQPIMSGSKRAYAMFENFKKYHWVLPVYRYKNLDGLLTYLQEKVIIPAEKKAQELEKR
jgi:uncharacterized protein YjbI with pentapeptide repeats